MFKLYTDGGARGNPGPSAAGVVLKDKSSNVVYESGTYLGVGTNNEAEYKALILGLEMALKKGVKKPHCYLDSELVVKQLNGEYKVKSANLKGLFGKVKVLENNFSEITYKHIPRSKNSEADKLLNEVLDKVPST